MLTIVFYTTNGAAAKLRSRELAAVKGDYVRVIDAGFWDGDPSKCDQVEIMPDVSGWQRKRIVQAYGNKIVEQETKEERKAEEEVEFPPFAEDQPVSVEKKAVHKGGGRWFVMSGDERISGPHDKAEAMRLAANEDAVA